MEVKAIGKYVSISPKKAREIADLIRGKDATSASNMLRFMPQVSAREVGKVLRSAMANAETNFNLDKDALVIAKITIDGGPTLKRWQPRAKGAAYEIKKRTSHIAVIVSGEIKTKKEETAKKEEKTADKLPESIERETEEHKTEIEKPSFIKKEQTAPKADVKSTFFRRKTG
jgi:large subunit ribosomal protein L22